MSSVCTSYVMGFQLVPSGWFLHLWTSSCPSLKFGFVKFVKQSITFTIFGHSDGYCFRHNRKCRGHAHQRFREERLELTAVLGFSLLTRCYRLNRWKISFVPKLHFEFSSRRSSHNLRSLRQTIKSSVSTIIQLFRPCNFFLDVRLSTMAFDPGTGSNWREPVPCCASNWQWELPSGRDGRVLAVPGRKELASVLRTWWCHNQGFQSLQNTVALSGKPALFFEKWKGSWLRNFRKSQSSLGTLEKQRVGCTVAEPIISSQLQLALDISIQ